MVFAALGVNVRSEEGELTPGSSSSLKAGSIDFLVRMSDHGNE